MVLLALTGTGGVGVAGQPPGLQQMLDKIVSNFGLMFSVLLGIGLVSMVIYSGSLYMFSGESAEKKAKAQASLTWTVVGGVIILSIVLVVNLLGSILGQGDINSITPGILK